MYQKSQIDRWIQSVGGGDDHTYISAEQEQALLAQTHDPDQRDTARSGLLAWHAAYLSSIAIEVYNSVRGAKNIEILDILHEGVIRFFEKIDTYDLAQDTRLTTWYTRDVKTAMQRFVFDQAFSVRQGSVFLQSVAYQIRRYTEEYLQQYGKRPTVSHLAEVLDQTESSISEAREFTKIQTDPIPEVFGSDTPPESANSPIDDLLSVLESKLQPLDFEDRVLIVYAIQHGTELPPDLQYELKSLEVLHGKQAEY